MPLICDTSAVYAALVRSDRLHEPCARLLGTRDDVVVPAPVVVEIDGLARSRGAEGATDALLRSVVDGSVHVEDMRLPDYARAQELMTRYASLLLGFVDAAIVAVAERLGGTTIATLDHRHFAVVRPRHCEAFTLLP